MKARFRSALFGTALGDAWGYPYQLPPQPESTPLPEKLIISDDTQMTLALAAAMRTIDEDKLERQAGMETIGTHFVAYHRDPDYDRFPGASNTESLERLEEVGIDHWWDAATHSGGSGAVMRVAASALLAPVNEGVGWSVLQAMLTHDSGVSRASAAVAAAALLTESDCDLLETASGLAGDAFFDADELLTSEEKSDILKDLNEALIRDLTGPDVPLIELVERAKECRKYLTPFLEKGDFEELYRSSRKFTQILGRGWDAGSCTVTSLLLSQLYLDHRDQYAPHDFLHVAVNWSGNRNTRGSLTGAMLGAHLDGGVDTWEETRSYAFENRYDEAIHAGVWRGFGSKF
ncbi:hypothetical protein F7230_08065 [Corynebacterium sp. 320]|uniref:ADP-ribosylglycohydrolase n=1 Tax=Corynebacterium zhongnanshanii TaxID=2768834 RepID=A0ABQ6VJ04_9CORY|nr:MULTISPECIES: ADP-ribosylglycohydrolase family protein [Corynebacterium]KAB1502391.1 hypothetical protein F7230_08065 [Corynebacterium sp. 320]KAB1551387.1 hypothetical protein F7233_07710 [Corynebacterium sp. 321]KAB1551784.1 hypothetical protein F7232_06560 [Corynebacterium sp. 319]KAB3520929.1 hypothetical protein F8377_06750 [Corynebacterium zhongnanshanii]KAB3525998.1 hypothetical protein F8354_08065 [Corynebacterium sp. 250]